MSGSNGHLANLPLHLLDELTTIYSPNFTDDENASSALLQNTFTNQLRNANQTTNIPSNLTNKSENSLDEQLKQQQQEESITSVTPQVCWSQSIDRIILHIFSTNIQDHHLSIEQDGTWLSFVATTKTWQGEKEISCQHKFELKLFNQVNERKWHCYRLKKYCLLEVFKKESNLFWPRLTRDPVKNFDWIKESSSETVSSLTSRSSIFDNKQQQTSNSLSTRAQNQEIEGELDEDDELVFDDKKSAYEEIERLLAQQLNSKQSTLDDRTASNYTSLNTNLTCDPNIFNPFKKKSHYLTRRRRQRQQRKYRASSKTCLIDNMKYDYRREQATIDTKNTVKHAMDCKKTYLFLYNLMMFIMFLMVYLILVIKCLTNSMDDDSVRGAAYIIKLLTYTQLLESVHPMLGLVPGGPFMPFLQVIGRLLVNHFLTDTAIRIDSAPYAHYLFIVWSSIEIFRYSFYALRVFKVDIYPITWCRYTLFIPLYPMGGYCEAQIVFATMREYSKTGAYSISLPNAANISFNLPLFLKLYPYVLLAPSIYYLMRYMWNQRCKQLKTKVA